LCPAEELAAEHARVLHEIKALRGPRPDLSVSNCASGRGEHPLEDTIAGFEDCAGAG
jgi:hypothetical protein